MLIGQSQADDAQKKTREHQGESRKVRTRKREVGLAILETRTNQKKGYRKRQKKTLDFMGFFVNKINNKQSHDYLGGKT